MRFSVKWIILMRSLTVTLFYVLINISLLLFWPFGIRPYLMKTLLHYIPSILSRVEIWRLNRSLHFLNLIGIFRLICRFFVVDNCVVLHEDRTGNTLTRIKNMFVDKLYKVITYSRVLGHEHQL